VPCRRGWLAACSDGLMHPSAWKGNSAKLNFALTEFSEVRMEDHA
jgi:hypothetical protein